MDAEGVGIEGEGVAGVGEELMAVEEPVEAARDGGWVGDEGIGMRTREHVAVAIITSIQERFVEYRDVGLFGERGYPALSFGDDNKMGERLMDGLEEGLSECFVGFCGVIESAVKFDVMEDGSVTLGDLVQGRDLLNHGVL